MASVFAPCLQGTPNDYPIVRPFQIEAASAIVPYDLVFLDTADNLVKPCGADPALILGIALSSGAAAVKSVYPGSAIPIAILNPDCLVAMASATTPAQAHLLRLYGIEKTGNNWRVDTTDTGNTRVTVIDYSPHSGDQGQEWFIVRFLAANLQGDSIVS